MISAVVCGLRFMCYLLFHCPILLSKAALNGARIAAILFCGARPWIFFELRFGFTSKHGIRGNAVCSAGAAV
jgi:hypothetical protein